MESPEPPPLSPAKKAERRATNWRRARIYFWALMIMAALWVGGTVIKIRYEPAWFVDKLLAQLPYYSEHGEVKWVNRRTLEVKYIKISGKGNIGPFFYADKVIVVASPWGLLQRHVAEVQIVGGQVFTKPLYKAMETGGEQAKKQNIDWVIGALVINHCTLMLNNLIEDVSIPVRLGVGHPLTIRGLRLGAPDASPDMKQERMAAIGPVNIVSPFDPVAPVFRFPLIQVKYTYEEMWHHHLRSVVLVEPTMYVGEDLFWFTKEFGKEHAKPTPTVGPEAPWEVGHFGIQHGQLAISAFGQPAAKLPFFFETEVDDIRLDQLDKLSVKNAIKIGKLSRDYPDYKLKIVDLDGDLYFSLPITDKNANNVVNILRAAEISWNNIAIRKVYSEVTYDPEGIYAKISGECEKGQLSGNFEFYYTKGFIWNLDFFAQKVDLHPIVQKLGGKDVSLTGELDGKLDVDGQVTEITKCFAELKLPKPGVLEIKSMDELLKHIPATGQLSLKDQATKLAVENFRLYPYDFGELKIDYTPAGGGGTLLLNGSRGKRQFTINYHPYDSSKVANDSNKQ